MDIEERRELLTDKRTIEVPLEAFAVLWAYEHTSCPKVPPHIREHPAWPGRHDGRDGHLIQALEAAAERAAALLKQKGDV